MAGFIRSSESKRTLLFKTSEENPNAQDARAFDIEDTLTLIVKCGENCRKCELICLSDSDGKRSCYEFVISGNEARLKIKLSDIARSGIGLYFVKFRIYNENGSFDLTADSLGEQSWRYSSDGYEGFHQLLIFKKRETLPEWFRGGIMYQIFVDRFYSSGKNALKDDAVLNTDWYNGIPPYSHHGEPFDNNVFFGGDLQGICEKLDYIASLGVSCIYLSPIFEAHSNHKYDTGDYSKVDSMFGGEKALDELIKRAAEKNIHIILDVVFNHTGNDSVYFNAENRYKSVGAYNSKESPYYGWYNFRRYPDDYECWWNIGILPRVKCDEATYRSFLFGEDGIVRRWMKKGIGGFRLDVADELSDNFLKELKSTVTREKEDALVIGEVWDDASNKISYSKRRGYFYGDELDSVMNYPIRTAILEYVKNGDYARFESAVKEIYCNYPYQNADFLMNVIGTHDTSRAITYLADESPASLTKEEQAEHIMSGEKYALGIKLMKLSYFIQCALPGVPSIYYGDEIGMQGYTDPFNRRPYKWGKENNELLEFYRDTGKMRRENDIFGNGYVRIAHIDSELLCIERYNEKEMLVLTANRSEKEYELVCGENAKELYSNRLTDRVIIEPYGCAALLMYSNKNYYVNEKLQGEKKTWQR